MAEVDLGQNFIGGFNSGLSIRRNMEETAKLVREREFQEDAQKRMKADMEKQQPLLDAMAVKRSELMDMQRKKRTGIKVDDEKLDLANAEVGDLMHEHFLLMQAQVTEAMKSGNPVYMKQSQDNLFNAVTMMTNIGQMTGRAQDRAAQAEQHANQLKSEEERAANRLKSEENRSAADIKMREAEMKSREKIAGVDDNSPLKKMKDTLALAEGVAAMDGAGWSDDQIKRAMGPGFDPEVYRQQWQGISEETKAQLKEARGYLKDLEKRQEEGEPGVGDLIEAQKEEIAELAEQERKVHDSELRQRRYRRNTPLAKRAADAFVNTLPNALGSAVKTFDDVARGLAGASGARAEDLVIPPNASAREFDMPPMDTEVPGAYPDEDGTYSQNVRDF